MISEMHVVRRPSRPAIIIPTFGQNHLTYGLVSQLLEFGDVAEVIVVDNQGSFSWSASTVQVLRPGSNLGWAGGCNFGLRHCLNSGFESYVLLNNDVALSPGFISGLGEAAQSTEGGIIGPIYDHNWPHQRSSYSGPASLYRPQASERQVPFIDGTCMMIPRSTIESVGLIDETSWPSYGWGCDKDYCLRVRSAGGSVWVTERAFLNHVGRQTARTIDGYSESEAELENDRGMAAKWGSNWTSRLYDGFPLVSQVGTVQERLAAEE